jgi:hypothetical protein
MLGALLLSACSPQQQLDAPETCQRAPGASQVDVDLEDTPETPWPRNNGEEVLVHFETSGLSGRYVGMVEKAAQIWSESPCLIAVAVTTCAEEDNCVAVEEKFSGGRNTDGEFSSFDLNGVREGGRITLYTRILDRASDNGALVTITHEMGHAVGLVHRRTKGDLMNATTNDATDAIPDGINFYNLAVIYGDAN